MEIISCEISLLLSHPSTNNILFIYSFNLIQSRNSSIREIQFTFYLFFHSKSVNFTYTSIENN